ncbi:MAG: LptF/LptG family permease [Armatimonas sp.]
MSYPSSSDEGAILGRGARRRRSTQGRCQSHETPGPLHAPRSLASVFRGNGGGALLLTTLKFFQGADSLSRSRMPFSDVLKDILWRMPGVLVMTLPVATALAASLATNRLSRDNELTPLRTAGVSLARLLRPLFVFAFIVAIANLAIAEWAVPWAARAQKGEGRMTTLAFEAGATLRSGSYLIKYDSAQRLTLDKRRLAHVMIIQRKPTITIWTAPFADYENGQFRLEDATLHQYNAADILVSEQKVSSSTLSLPIDFSAALRVETETVSSFSFAELTRSAVEARRRGEWRKAQEFEVNRWFKLSLPSLCFSLGLLAPPLALRFSRAGGFTGVLLSIITVFVAWNTLLLLQYVGQAGLLPPLVAAWSTNVLFGIVGLVLLWSAE